MSESETGASRYFKQSEPVDVDAAEAVEAAEDKPRRGRRKAQRQPQQRHDVQPAPIDGYGDPLTSVKLAAGWTHSWATDADRDRHWNWPWEEARHGDKRIVSIGYGRPGKTGEPVRFRELQLMLMRTEDAKTLRDRDARMVQHRQLREAIGHGVVTPSGEMAPNSSATSFSMTLPS